MYVHIGQNVNLRDRHILAVMDMDRATAHSADFRQYLLKAEKDGSLEWLGPEIPRSVVITDERIYLTPVRSATIRERMMRFEVS